MQDRMTVSAYTWRTDAPPVNTVCEVWHENRCRYGSYTNGVWCETLMSPDGSWHVNHLAQMPSVTHWRPYHA